MADWVARTACFGAGMLSELRQIAAAVFGPRQPEQGERAAGHGLSGSIVAVPDLQPLAGDNIWRVRLADERCGRLVGRGLDGAWRLLQLDDMTEAQLAAFDAVMLDPAQREMPTVAEDFGSRSLPAATGSRASAL